MNIAKSRLLIGILTLVGQVWLVSCVTATESDVTVTPSATEDEDYKEALDKATRQRTVYKNFETKAIIQATYLSPEFRTAFANRLNRVFKRDEAHFSEAKDRAAFFVVVQVPGLWEDRNNLADPHQWSVLLESGQGPVKPVLIKQISDKERWRPYFKGVTMWSSEFLVVFDTPSVNANSEQMVVKTPVKLTIANADAQLNLNW